MHSVLILALAAPALLANADPVGPSAPPPAAQDTPEIPATIRSMLDAAIGSDNDGEVTTIVKYARIVDPGSADEVARLADAWRKEKATRHDFTIREAGFFDLWAGKVELGGYVTTGNTQNKGVTGALALTRESVRWRHKITAQADYQESLGITSREHYLAAYEPNFKFDRLGYVYGAAQYESDKFLGYYNRYSASLGAGYSAIKQANMTLDVELGPAFRSTEFTDDATESSIAGRGSLNFNWKLTPTISVGQNASAYVQHYNSTVSSTTALSAKLIGPLAAKLSYAVQYESQPPAGRVSTDTTGRASLVYSF
jgi:putative salt-induced outer membrane protein